MPGIKNPDAAVGGGDGAEEQDDEEGILENEAEEEEQLVGSSHLDDSQILGSGFSLGALTSPSLVPLELDKLPVSQTEHFPQPGTELYRALAGDADPLDDPFFWTSDYVASQKEFLQRRLEEQLLQRIERRIGTVSALPQEEPSSSHENWAALRKEISHSTETTGSKFKDLISTILPIKRTLSSLEESDSLVIGRRRESVEKAEEDPSQMSPAISQTVSAINKAPASIISLEAAEEVVSVQGGVPAASPRRNLDPRSPISVDDDHGSEALLLPSPRLDPHQSPLQGLKVMFKQSLGHVLRPTRSQDNSPRIGDVGGKLGILAEEASIGEVTAQQADAIAHLTTSASEELKGDVDKKEGEDAEGQVGDNDTLQQYHPIRRFAIMISTHNDFEMLVVLLIFANCITLAMFRPLEDSQSSWNSTLETIELAFNVAFTAEMLLRIISVGSVIAYLAKPWNLFDSLMVAAGYTTFIPAAGNSTAGVRALRAMRALRPLRTITRFESLRSIVVCFLEAVPLLVSVGTLLVFFLFLFGVIGVQLFQNVYHKACFNDATGLIWETENPDEFGCGPARCPPGYSCKATTGSVATNVAGFDNAAMGMLTVFQCMTLSGWVYIMYRTMDATNPASCIYYILVVVFGGYFVINLFLAVLKTKFAKAQSLFHSKVKQNQHLRAGLRKKKQRSSILNLGGIASKLSDIAAGQAAKSALVAHLNKVHGATPPGSRQSASRAASHINDDLRRATNSQSGTRAPTPMLDLPTPGASAAVWSKSEGLPPSRQEEPRLSTEPRITFHPDTTPRDLSARPDSTIYEGSDVYSQSEYSVVSGSMYNIQVVPLKDFDGSLVDVPVPQRWLMMAKYRCFLVVTHKAFSNFFLACIILNTVALAMEYDGMSAQYSQVLSDFNLVFTALFAAELVVKLIGLGFWDYVRDKFNLFDALVVAMSLVELGLSGRGGTGSIRSVRSLRVLRSFRVLRILKVFRYLQSLKKIGEVLMQSMGSFLSIAMLIILFWIVFAIVGLHVFGGLKLDEAWPNYDTFILALVSVFNVLNLEDWEITMFAVARASNEGSLVYSVVWVILGKFIFMTLFLAVTLEAFESKYDVDTVRAAKKKEKSWWAKLRRKRYKKERDDDEDTPRSRFSISGFATLINYHARRQTRPFEGNVVMPEDGPLKSPGNKAVINVHAGPITSDGGAEESQRVPLLDLETAVRMWDRGRGPMAGNGGPMAEGIERSESKSFGNDEQGAVPSTSYPLHTYQSLPALDDLDGPFTNEAESYSFDEFLEVLALLGGRQADPITTAAPLQPSCSNAFHQPATWKHRSHRVCVDVRTQVYTDGKVQTGSHRPGGANDDFREWKLTGWVEASKGRSLYEWAQRFRHLRVKKQKAAAGTRVALKRKEPSAQQDGHCIRRARPLGEGQEGCPSPVADLSFSLASGTGSLPPETMIQYGKSTNLRPSLPSLRPCSPRGMGRSFNFRGPGSPATPQSPFEPASDDFDPSHTWFSHNGSALAALESEDQKASLPGMLLFTEDDNKPTAAGNIKLNRHDSLSFQNRQGKLLAGKLSLVSKGNLPEDPQLPALKTMGNVPVTVNGVREWRATRQASALGGPPEGEVQGSAEGGNVAGPASTLVPKLPLGDLMQVQASGDSRTSLGSDSSIGTSTILNSNRTDQSSKAVPDLIGKSFFILDEDNPFRQWLYDLVTHKFFDNLMFFFILLNCIALAAEHPGMVKGSVDWMVLHYADIAFTVLFTIEAILKMVAFSVTEYLSFGNNQVDLMIVVTSIVLLAIESADIKFLKGLRVLRAVKPLRALTRSAGMQLVFHSVTRSLAAMANVSLVCLLFFVIFAIMGVQLFSGKFYRCNDNGVSNKSECVGMFLEMDSNATLPRTWSNAHLNFDNVGNALLTLFMTSTLSGYTGVIYDAMAAPHTKDLQPQPMGNWSAFFYFVAFIMVVAFTLLNLYIGVVFYQFSRIRMLSQTGSAFLTVEQTEWTELSKMVFRLKPPDKTPVPKNPFRRKLFFLVVHRYFDMAIMTVICTNVLAMAFTHYGEPTSMVRNIEKANLFFSVIFILEAVLRITGLGWLNYWKSAWNKFDFLLVLSSLLDLVILMASHDLKQKLGALGVQKLLRLLRMIRIVKLVKGMKGLRSLISTLIISLPAFWNVGALVGLLLFMYAYSGVLLFGTMKFQENLNSHANFQKFPIALLTLVRVATLDNWVELMVDMVHGHPDCDKGKQECGSWVVIPYFISFVLSVTIIMLNLFTAIIIENFEKQQEQEAWRLNPNSLENFVELWSRYDDGSGKIEPKQLEELLLELDPPLGLGRYADGKDVLRFVFDLDIPLVNGRVPFHRTLYELVKRCSGADIPEGAIKEQLDQLVNKFFKNMRHDEVLNFSVAVTVMRVQRKWRARLRANKIKRKKEWRQSRQSFHLNFQEVLASRHELVEKIAELSLRKAGKWRVTPRIAGMSVPEKKLTKKDWRTFKKMATFWKRDRQEM